MSTVTAPTPSEMDLLDGRSIVTMERVGGSVLFKNRSGTTVGSYVIRDSVSPAYIEAIKTIGSFDSPYREILVKKWLQPNGVNIDVDTISGTPTPAAGKVSQGIAWSPDGNYVAQAFDTWPYYFVYQRSGDTFTPVAVPSFTFPQVGHDCAWSPDGRYLAFVGTDLNGTKFIVNVIKRLASSLSPIDGISDTAFNGAIESCAWSPDGNYLALGGGSTGTFLRVYKRSGDNIDSLVITPTPQPASRIYEVSYSPGGKYLAAVGSGSPHLYLYKQNGDTFTKLTITSANLPGIPSYTVAWSPNGRYLAVGGPNTITIYKRDGDTITKTEVRSLVGMTVTSLAWTPDNNYILYSSNQTGPYDGYLEVKNGVTIASGNSLSDKGASYKIAVSPDGKYVARALKAAPYISISKSNQMPIPGAAVRLSVDSES